MKRKLLSNPTMVYPVLVLAVVGGLFAGCGLFKAKIPVVVSYRDSLLDESKVVRVTNASKEVLYQVEITIGEKKYFKDKVNPDETIEVGWLQLDNYKPTAKDEVKISAMNYKSFGPLKIEECKKTDL